MNSPNYRDFYHKSLIPIGSNDQHHLMAVFHAQMDPPASLTHWLIALQGELAPKTKEYYHWKVMIFPCDCEGIFDYQKPYYTSNAYEHIQHAFEVADNFERYGKNDEMSSISLQEKIS